jgi:hypothetical protein
MDLKKIFKKSRFVCPTCSASFEIGPDFKSIASFVFDDILTDTETAQALDEVRAELAERFEFENAEHLESALAGALKKKAVLSAIIRAAGRSAKNGQKRQQTATDPAPRSDLVDFLDSFLRFK